MAPTESRAAARTTSLEGGPRADRLRGNAGADVFRPRGDGSRGGTHEDSVLGVILVGRPAPTATDIAPF
jgi:hypothetical protein